MYKRLKETFCDLIVLVHRMKLNPCCFKASLMQDKVLYIVITKVKDIRLNIGDNWKGEEKRKIINANFIETEKKKNQKHIKIGIFLMVLAPVLYVLVFVTLGIIYCNITGNSFFL